MSVSGGSVSTITSTEAKNKINVSDKEKKKGLKEKKTKDHLCLSILSISIKSRTHKIEGFGSPSKGAPKRAITPC